MLRGAPWDLIASVDAGLQGANIVLPHSIERVVPLKASQIPGA